MSKKVLLIAGGGTLGTHTANELLRLGAEVDVICLEEKISDRSALRFYQTPATDEFLDELFEKNHYDAIVNFIHYEDPEEYRRVYPKLIKNTDHLVFLSSYRVYADEEHPITEESPRLYDVLDDEEFLKNETYAVPKSKCEDFLRNECANDPFTIVRPVISFSERRFDLLMYSGRWVFSAVEEGRAIALPESARRLHAGIDWAGNSGKLIANLLFKPHTFGKTYNICSGHNMTWEEVAEIYHEVFGINFRWVSDEEYIDAIPTIREPRIHGWMWYCDRRFDRQMDASKVLEATGLSRGDLATLREGLIAELKLVK